MAHSVASLYFILSGLLMYSGPEKEEDGATDFIALGLMDGTPVFKVNLGSKPEEFVSKSSIKLNEPNTIKLVRNKKDGKNN